MQHLSDAQAATIIFAMPFLALAIGGAIAQISIYRVDHLEELSRLRSLRVAFRKDRS